MTRDITVIPVDKIALGDRLRPIDPDRALFLASSIERDGLSTPIEVRRVGKGGKFALVVGGHRLEAVRALGRSEIEAYVLDVSVDEARMREIDENLYRVELSSLDRALFIAEKKALYEKMHPSARHGGDRRSDQVAIFGDLIARFTTEACEKLNCSERTLQRMAARAKIDPAVRARIAFTPLAHNGSELDALVKLTPDEQMAAVELILQAGDDAPRSVAAAARIARGERLPDSRPADPTDTQLADLLSAWRRAGAKARLAFMNDEGVLDFLASQRDEAPAKTDREAA